MFNFLYGVPMKNVSSFLMGLIYLCTLLNINAGKEDTALSKPSAMVNKSALIRFFLEDPTNRRHLMAYVRYKSKRRLKQKVLSLLRTIVPQPQRGTNLHQREESIDLRSIMEEYTELQAKLPWMLLHGSSKAKL
jgi:hypothetical protein